jgi:cell wall-associated NlpC family hydrolase
MVHRRRRRFRRRYGSGRRHRVPGGLAVPAVAVAVGLAALSAHHGAAAGGPPGRAAAAAIAYARAQLGKPYLWGGTGPGAFDCSGLVMAAYAAAGVTTARTSQEQWATEPHVTAPQAGDLVFFTGALQPGEQPPGHVGLVVDPARHLMIDAYGTGTGVRYDTYGLASSAAGLSAPWGFTDPAGST